MMVKAIQKAASLDTRNFSVGVRICYVKFAEGKMEIVTLKWKIEFSDWKPILNI